MNADLFLDKKQVKWREEWETWRMEVQTAGFDPSLGWSWSWRPSRKPHKMHKHTHTYAPIHTSIKQTHIWSESFKALLIISAGRIKDTDPPHPLNPSIHPSYSRLSDHLSRRLSSRPSLRLSDKDASSSFSWKLKCTGSNPSLPDVSASDLWSSSSMKRGNVAQIPEFSSLFHQEGLLQSIWRQNLGNMRLT